MTMQEVTEVLMRRRVLIIVVTAVVFVVGLVAVLAGGSTSYTARTQVLLDQPDLVGAPDGASVPNKFGALLPTFCRMVTGDEEISRIATQAKTDPGTVRGRLSCDPVSGTTVLLLSVKDSDAARAQSLAATAGDVVASDLTRRYSSSAVPPRDVVKASVLESARRPGKAPRHVLRQLALLLVGGLVVGVVIAVAAEPFSHREDSDADVASRAA